MKVAFLGLGLMGAPMARRLAQAGHELTVWNRTQEKCREFAAHSARIAATPAEAADGADYVLMCLLDTQVVEQVMFGATGIVEGISRDSCVIDFSTIDPQWVRAAHARLRAALGVEWIDAPVSGGVQGAAEGTLVAFCGGAPERIAAARPLLSSMVARMTHFGPTGSGLAAKLCNQTIVANQLVAIAEAVSLARHAGIDPQTLIPALQGGFADSTLLRIFGPRFAAATEQPRIGQIYTMLETLEMARALGASAGADMPLSAASAAVYRAVGAAGRLVSDLGALISFYHKS